MKFAVAHLIDDASFGGINRMLEYLEGTSGSGMAHHTIVRVKRGQSGAPPMNADVVVSHLSTSWANMALFTALRGRYPNTPLIHVEHSYCERFSALNVSNRTRFQALLRNAYAIFDEVVAVSEAQAEWLLRRGVVDPQALQTIHPCVDLEPFFAAGRSPAPANNIVGAIGRFDTQKGFDILIRAFEHFRTTNFQLHLYGDGPQRDSLRELAAGLPYVVFKGFAADPAEAIAACDAIAMPSRWEPFGLVALEAMAVGRPLICHRADGMASHLETGAVDVAENTPASWAACLKTVFADPRPSGRGKRHAQSAPRIFQSQWSELLETMMAEKGTLGASLMSQSQAA